MSAIKSKKSTSFSVFFSRTFSKNAICKHLVAFLLDRETLFDIAFPFHIEAFQVNAAPVSDASLLDDVIQRLQCC